MPLMQVAPSLEQTLIRHIHGLLEYNIPEFCRVVLERRRFSKVGTKFAMFKLSLAIILPLP